MKYTIQGTLHHVAEKQQISDKLTKREFVIQTEEQYPQLIKFELTNDKTDVVKPQNVGAKVTVDFYVKGREWNGKYFVNLNAVWVKSDAGDYSPTQQADEAVVADKVETAAQEQPFKYDEDLPF